jgi:ATP-dependent DNA helicase RecG
LKELDLTEGRATGIPTIQKHLRDNGSEPAVIETDDDRSYFLITIPCRKDMVDTTSYGADNDDNRALNEQLGQILESLFVQVQDTVYQNIILNKKQLVHILGQISVQVWDKSRNLIDKQRMVKSLIDTICILEKGSSSAQNINQAISFGDIKDLKRKILIPLMDMNYVVMTNPDKPTSSKQQYKLTDTGRKLFK